MIGLDVVRQLMRDSDEPVHERLAPLVDLVELPSRLVKLHEVAKVREDSTAFVEGDRRAGVIVVDVQGLRRKVVDVANVEKEISEIVDGRNFLGSDFQLHIFRHSIVEEDL